MGTYSIGEMPPRLPGALLAQLGGVETATLGLTRPGDVIVVDRLGDERYACWGGGVTNAARQAQLAGAVIDGPCTDPSEIRSQGFALWCRGVSPITTRVADVGGTLNQPVSCGGVVVR